MLVPMHVPLLPLLTSKPALRSDFRVFIEQHLRA